MTGRKGKWIVAALIMGTAINLWAQAGKKPAKKATTPAPVKTVAPAQRKVLTPGIYLGNEQFGGGAITTTRFSNLLRQGIKSHDSTGNSYEVINFTFGFAERRMYEDSAGTDLHMITDYMSEPCVGDTISESISNEIYDRIKPGDTVYLSNVLVRRKNAHVSTDTMLGGTLKCYFVK